MNRVSQAGLQQGVGQSIPTSRGEEWTTRIERLPQGYDALRNPSINKGEGFSLAERSRQGLVGLLPPAVTPTILCNSQTVLPSLPAEALQVKSLELQAKRVMSQLAKLQEPLHKYVFLMALQARHPLLV